MLGGNNENPLPQVLMNGNQFQYQSNTSLNQLHLLGTMRAGCTTDPVNYFANDNLAPMIRHNSKRGREAEINNNIQRQQKLQISLNYNNYNNNNSVVQDELPKQNLVSTGLRLSYDDDDEQNSSVTCANGSITTPVFQSLGDNIRLDLDRQKDELDQFIKFRADKMAKGVRDIKQRHVAFFVTALEKDVSKKIQEKDQEVESMNKKNRELVEKIKQVAVEAQNWHYKAKYNESVVKALKAGLVADHHQAKEEFGDSEINDEAASYNYLNVQIVPSAGMGCKSCNIKEVLVFLVPCRHLNRPCIDRHNHHVSIDALPLCQSTQPPCVDRRKTQKFRIEPILSRIDSAYDHALTLAYQSPQTSISSNAPLTYGPLPDEHSES
ncbi:unnamed protein product [Arabis nemorensis]|uniref:RING-type domain-containing protein n=1 Tax=Arabis nemorensis TaxID=586526 RepID=A0A565AXE1_9BRAS|nr:unnamed protein product [Arabis nemorensis]